MKKASDIVINGRRYDARTGQPLTHGTAPRPASEHRADHTTPTHGNAAHEHKPAHRAGYRPTRHIAAHRPRPAQTLMRQAVKRPQSEVRRRIKVQGRLDIEGGRESSRIVTHRPVNPANMQGRRHHAVKGSKGQVISHFSPHLFTSVDFVAVEPPRQKPALTAAVPAAPSRKPTTDEILEYAVQHASVPKAEHAPHKRRGILRRRTHRVHAH